MNFTKSLGSNLLLSPFFILFTVVFLLSSVSSFAQDEEESSQDKSPENPELYITANLNPTPKNEINSSISVITNEEIENSQKRFLSDILRSQPGLEVAQTGTRGGVTSVFIRGGEADHTLVLIDGLRVNSSATGQFDFADIDTENIERVEIVRGPQSILYGSGAIAGVINIITKKGSGPLSSKIKLSAGSFTTENYSYQVSQGGERFNFSLDASYVDSGGFTAASRENGASEDDGYDRTAFSGRFGGKLLSDGEFAITSRYTQAETELDGFDFEIGPVDDLDFRQETDTYSGSITLKKPITEYLKAEFIGGYSQTDLEGSDESDEFNNFDITSRRTQGTALLKVHSLWSGNLILGYDLEEEETENENNFDEESTVNAFFIENLYDFGPAVVTAGIRYEDDTDFGDEVLWRVTGSYNIQPSLQIKASFAKGFRAPSFNELFFPNFGNPDLNAETSRTFDIGLTKSLLEDKINFDVTFFRSDVDELIGFSSETFLAANIDEANIHGIETGVDLNLFENFSSRFFYNFTDTENEETGDQLARRPKHRAGAEVNYTLNNKLYLGVSWLLVNSRIDSDLSAMDNYDKIDLRASYSVNEHIKPFVRLENIFDEDFEEINGFESAGQSVFAGVELSL